MGTLPTDKVFAKPQVATKLKPEYTGHREARHLMARKRVYKSIFKLKNRIMHPTHTSYCNTISRSHLKTVAVPTSTILPACYPYQHNFNYPITMNNWLPFRAPLVTVPIIIQPPTPIFTTHISPIIGAVVPPLLSPVLPQTFLHDMSNVSNYTNEFNYSTELIEELKKMPIEQESFVEEATKRTEITNTDDTKTNIEIKDKGDPIESYLKLPKELFPTPNMLAVDPNPIIDELCKLPNLQRHMPWLLDLEFGIPKTLITRPIPTYNVKLNSIHCKNTPDAIHPLFEVCNQDFQKALLFYYDCVVSAWYKGYMIMNSDKSVDNFQSWLLIPMQDLGMCWA